MKAFLKSILLKSIWIIILFLGVCPGKFYAGTTFYHEKDLRELFLREFKKQVSQLKGEIELYRFRVEPENVRIPMNSPYKVDWIGLPRAGSNTAVFIFNPESATPQVVRIWAWVEVKVPVPVIKRNLSAKTLIKEEDLAFEMKELSKLPHDVLLEVGKIVGKETRTSLKAGSILRSSYLAEPVLIKRNQEVEIVARGKGLIVKAKGLALENGRKDELIRVRNISSQKIIQAKVAGEGLVEVNF